MFSNSLIGNEISLCNALALNYQLEELILSDSKPVKIKSSKSLIREFDEEKWSELLNLLKTNCELDIEELEAIEDGNKKNHIFRNNKNYLSEPGFLREYIKENLSIFVQNMLKEFNSNTIIELGSGYGSKLLYLHKRINKLKDFKHIALDISQNGLLITKHFGDLYQLDLDIEYFNFRKDSFEELSFNRDSILFTIYGLHYIKQLKIKHINEFISGGVKGGIHFEPCFNLINNLPDKLYSSLAKKYMIYNDYTLNIFEVFKEAENKDIIELEIGDEICGNGLLPCSWIKWKAKI